MRILGIERDKSACNYYRILQPLSKMDELNMAEVQMIQESALGDERSMNAALWADIIVFQRPATEAWFNFIKICRKIGKIVVSDYDDDPFNTSPLNPYYAWIGTEEVAWQWPDGTREMLWSDGMTSPTGQKIFSIEQNINHRDMFKANFKKSDLVTCTTPILRESFLKINPNVAVLPNVIDPTFFPSGVEMVKRGVRIGWQGGASHYEDLYLVHEAIKNILLKNPSAKFIYFGDIRFKGLFKDCPQDQVEYHPWVNHSTYPYKMALMNLDIALCPLVDNVFNRNKSAIKWMEYSLVGAATIASDIPPYSEVINSGMTGLLVKEDEKSWIENIQLLIDNKKYREQLASNSRINVIENHSAEKSAHLWLEAYERLMKGETVTA